MTPRPHTILLCLGLSLSLSGCRDDDPKSDDSADESADPDAAFTPTLPTAACGMPAYTWRSTESMGTLLAHDNQDNLSFPASGLDALLGSIAETASLVPVRNGVEVHFVRYLTQDRGEEAEATGMIVLPDADAGLADAPVILWLHPTTGIADDCAPTALGLEGAAFPILFASMGFVVVAPDYLGMAGWGEPSPTTHPYIIAEPTAISSLDALRALDRLAEVVTLPTAPDRDRLVIWGVSQGGFAALWTERYLPHYLPHYTPVGTIATIPPTDLPALATHGVQTLGPTALGLAAAQITMQRWYRSPHDLTEVFVPDVVPALEQVVDAECDDFSALDSIETVEDLYAADYIQGVLDGDMDPWLCFLQESTLRTTAVPRASDTPTLMIVAEEDDLAIAAPARADAAALCAQGYRIEYLECAGVGHVDGAVLTLKQQLAWAEARAAGDTWDASGVCVIGEPQDCGGE